MQNTISGYFVCPKGHSLKWKTEYISECGICGPITCYLSRFGCESCGQKYCIKCIQPPVMGDYCGGGHPMFYQEKISGHSCDICAKSITGSLYRCQTCDYDVCKNCHIEKED